MYNLLNEPWLPVRRRSGERQRIASWQITDKPEDAIVALDFPRPDFNGSVMQFLIGLYQVTLAPWPESDWLERFTTPPTPQRIREAFQAFEKAFLLDGEGYRFMQDLSAADAEPKSISAILIEAPGQQSIRENKDFFVKDGFANTLCRSCASAALYTMQSNAPAGGKGFRTSLRGGGPLSTVLYADSLWHSIVLNTLPGNVAATVNARLFPWLTPMPTSEKQEVIIPTDVAPMHEYWGMPRRIFFHFSDQASLTCDVCGGSDTTLVTKYSERNYGPNYQSGVWKHPLTPVYVKDDMPRSPVHASAHCLHYRHWPSYVLPGGSGGTVPAPVVELFLSMRNRDLRDENIDTGDIGLNTFGYDMDKMKARCWYEGRMPVFNLPAEELEVYRRRVEGMIEAATLIGGNTVKAVRRAQFGRVESISKNGAIKWTLPKGNSDDAALPQSLTDAFWQYTESQFYRHIHQLRDIVGDTDKEIPLMRSWNDVLSRQAETLFDAIVDSEDYSRTNPRNVVLARKELYGMNRSKKIFELLNIPLEIHAFETQLITEER
ncbi:MAG: type I-E CRISPR-associated protein Cse1/CasA [Ignavibacteriae bacterium]|nr:type I-E CRISPR-associated protein Cse1/CasA [Ignavibacteriota bacterium]